MPRDAIEFQRAHEVLNGEPPPAPRTPPGAQCGRFPPTPELPWGGSRRPLHGRPRARASLCARATDLRSPPSGAVAHEISTTLGTGLDKQTLSVLIALVEAGVTPEALAAVVKELRKERAALLEVSQHR